MSDSVTNPGAASGLSQRPQDLPPIPPGPPLLIVLSSVAGAGKDAVRDLLMEWGLPFHFVVTATNRLPRAGELPGVHYHFLSDEDFNRQIAADGFIEHAIVYGQKKGVPRSEVAGPLLGGQDVLARVDVQGAETLRSLFGPATVLIWIAPPSLDEAERRMEERESDDLEQRRIRANTAASEVERSSQFDYVVVNETGRLAETARRVIEIVAAEKVARATREPRRTSR